MSDGGEAADVPEVPGPLALLGLLFFRPLTLHRMFRAWGLERDPALWRLVPRRREPHVRQLVGRMLVVQVILPIATVCLIGAVASVLGLEWRWALAISGVAIGVAVGVAFGVAIGLAFGVVLGVALGLACGVAYGAVAAGSVAAGEPDRGHPHRILAARLHAAVPDLPDPPGGDVWGPTLKWFQTVDDLLAERDHRVLLAIDEIERLQDGFTAGWVPPDFLDFLRAAGDQLEHIRMLLVSAHPMQRLGEIWCDRLISAIQRPIGPLEPEHARELLESPIEDFPPIWPTGAVDRICRLTGNHPFLLQAVGNKVVQALNTRGAMEANDDDVQRALDRAVESAALFPDLWKDRTDGERALLRRLAGSDEADSLHARPLDDPEQTAAAWLRREGFIIDEADKVRIATPLFATWIRIYGTPNT